MIPILQFDPATLTLWYDTQLLSTSRASRDVGLALHAALEGRDDVLECIVRQQSDDWVKTRAANVASAVWHEKRHFLDFVLTNYGAMRLRHFFMAYMNAATALRQSHDAKALILPLDRLSDPLRTRALGYETTDPDLLSIAESFSNMKEMLRDDRRPLVMRGVTYEISGEAIMESIAYHTQLGKVHRVFDGAMNASVQLDTPDRETIANKYRWAHTLLIQAKLLSFTVEDNPAADGGALKIDDEPLIPILYGALASRYYGQEQTTAEFSSSYHPGPRLSSLVQHLQAQNSNIAKKTSADAWEEVNDACRSVFGRSAIEETEADYVLEEALIDRYAKMGTNKVLDAYRDFHTLRGQFIDVLKTDPDRVLNQAGWSDNMVNQCQPFVVSAAPAGVLGDPPDGYIRLAAYEEPGVDVDAHPEFKWWWTALQVPKEQKAEVFRLRDQTTWSEIAREYAPLAKLMFDGYRMRSMVGPELVYGRRRIQHLTGIEIYIDPAARVPDEPYDIAQWYYLTGQDRFRCQVTHRVVHAPSGRLIAPWEIRRRPDFLWALCTFFDDGARQRMVGVLRRDWSPWLVCDEVAALFDATPIDPDAEV